ncbi:MAG: YwiC-like family protein [Deltaproteobacteria bacterium]|nr:YwiC-like family protein [Deltaproteobacteria bacterium]
MPPKKPKVKVVPREHGGTVMILAGALAGFFWEPVYTPEALAMLLAITAAFFARDPVGLWLKRPAAPPATRAVLLKIGALWGGLALLSGGYLLFRLPLLELGILAALGLPLFGLLVFARATRRERQAWAEAIGVASLGLPPAALHLAAVGELDAQAGIVSGACLLFFTGSTLHLRALVRDRKVKGEPPPPSRAWIWGPVAALVGIGLHLAELVPLAFAAANALAFLRPLVMRGWITQGVMRVGFAETGLTLAFLLLLVLL